MGDRRNLLVETDNGTICLYTHWDGSELPETIARALKTGDSRWTDHDYLVRILFGHMIGGNWNGTTGYGVSISSDGVNATCEADSNYDLYLNINDQTVRIGHGGLPLTYDEWIESYR